MMYRPPLSLPNRNLARLDNAKICEIRFRVPVWMKEDFHLYCEGHDLPVSHVLRRLIRDVLKKNQEPAE